MNTNSTEIKKYNFIKNQPLGEDLFENKSQEKIATVISEKIINESNFKVIGIDGEWGSGKSNLVRLIEKKLEKSHKFFIYDVWGHQEDEQRKSILIELTEFIKNEKDLLKKENKKTWDEKLKFLLAKSKETTTINQPYLSVGFIFSLLSIVYIPTVNVFKDSMKDFFKIESWFWKLVLVAFPVFIVIGIYFWNTFKYLREKNGFGQSLKLSAEETFQVYTNKQKEETKIETISEEQPSVRDFQSWMEEINNDLSKPIVIVFDNFDRLPKKHIQNIWSSIHIFFAEKEYANIKIIIPFDREHIQNAFKDLNGTDSKFGDDYINKTFDIVFRITLPIMSNWKMFFEEQWKKAFETNDEEMRYVIQVYEFLNRRITPREIISFINEILTIKLLDENFKERYIAIFVLKKDEILKSPLKAVTDFKDILGGLYHIYLSDSEYSKQLTAIIYHIEVEKALELIYTQELKDSMLKKDIEHFNEICNSDFINSMFYSSMIDIETFENPILTLASLKENSKVTSQNIEQTWKLFNDRILQFSINITSFQINDWEIALIKNTSDNKYLSMLLNANYKLVADSNIEQYIDLIDGLIIEIPEDRVMSQIENRNISNINFIKLVEYIGKDYEKYKLFTDYTLLDEYISNLNIDDILKLKNTYLLYEKFDFIKYKESLKNSFNTFIEQNNIKKSYDVLFKIKEISRSETSLINLIADNKIYELFNYDTEEFSLKINVDLIAMRIARGSNFSSSYANKFIDILNSEDEILSEELSENILYYIGYGDLLLLSDYFKNHILFKQIILKMFNKTNLKKSANVKSLIENYAKIKESLDIKDNLILIELNKLNLDKANIDIDNLSDGFIKDCIGNPDLKISKIFLEVFNEEFSNLDIEGYETVFKNETDVHFKFFNLLELKNLTQTSLDVFEKNLIERLKSIDKIETQRWEIFSIFDSNNSNISIVNILKNILDEILVSKIELKLNTSKRLLPYFVKYDLLKNRNDIFRLVIKNEFLLDSEFIKLITTNSNYIKDLYNNANPLDKEGFRNLLNEKRKDNSEFEDLAISLDIKKSKE